MFLWELSLDFIFRFPIFVTLFSLFVWLFVIEPTVKSLELEKERAYDWMQRLSRSLIRFETQDIKTQPLFNHFLSFISSPKPEIIFGIPLMIDSWLLVYGCGITDELCECHSRVCFEPRLETTFIFINRRLLNSSEGHQHLDPIVIWLMTACYRRLGSWIACV